MTGIMGDEDNPQEERLDSVCDLLSGATEEVTLVHTVACSYLCVDWFRSLDRKQPYAQHHGKDAGTLMSMV